jgi:hypothetical protein
MSVSRFGGWVNGIRPQRGSDRTIYSHDMRWRVLAIIAFVLALVPGMCRSQTVAGGGAGQSEALGSAVLSELQRALTGAWVGTLEYRDYSEPVTSTKRVKLPTWLAVEPVIGVLRFSYVYDDGPTKTVAETSVIRLDLASAKYEVTDGTGKVDSTYAVAGLDGLKQGRGVLTLTGKGTENDVPVDVRETLRIGRNIMEMTRETSADGREFNFRHTYTFVRANTPAVHP